MSYWPDLEKEMKSWEDRDLDAKWEKILDIRDGMMKILEIKREEGLIGSSLEAAVTLHSDNGNLQGFMKENVGLFPMLFKVSKVEVVEKTEKGMEDIPGKPFKAAVSKADGTKCQRCWNFSDTVGKNKDYPDICERCYNVTLERSKNG